jgi:hypothetical protein
MHSAEPQPLDSSVEETRGLVLELLAATRRDTRSAFSEVDPQLTVHDDKPAWRVRDVLGHLAVWNGEAAKSLRAHARGEEYHCIPSAHYDQYNATAAAERGAWPMARVWAEYEASGDQLKTVIDSMPMERWNAEVLFPWNERGTVRRLIEIMMRHDVEHREVVAKTRE